MEVEGRCRGGEGMVRDSWQPGVECDERTGASCECSMETDVAISHSRSAVISKNFLESISAITREKGEGLRAKVCSVFKLNVNSFV